MIDYQRLGQMAKGMFCCAPEWTFVARDFSSIEGVLVGWFMHSPRFIRLAKLDLHTYFMAHGLLYPDGLITQADLPDLAWTDVDLLACFKVLKKQFKGNDDSMSPRQVAKRTGYLSLYGGTAGKMVETFPDSFSTKKIAAQRQGAFFDLFPEIPKWHEELTTQVDKTGYVRAPSGFIMRFFRVREWTKVEGKWTSKLGDSGKELIAALPQHTAAAIGRQALRQYWNEYENYRQYLRLFIHDEILCECPIEQADEVDRVLQEVMERAISWLPLDPAWGLGPLLSIGSEGKRGTSWGSMT